MSRRVHPARSGGKEPFFDLDQAVSCTECTGLLPAQVETDDEAENLAALQGILRVRPVENKTKRKKP